MSNEVITKIPSVVDALNSTSTIEALSANQGRVLDGKIPPVVDNLTSTSTTSALSANQGKVLDGKIPPVVNNLTSTSTTSALSAYQGKVLDEKNAIFCKSIGLGQNKTLTVTTTDYTIFHMWGVDGSTPINYVFFTTDTGIMVDRSSTTGNVTITRASETTVKIVFAYTWSNIMLECQKTYTYTISA